MSRLVTLNSVQNWVIRSDEFQWLDVVQPEAVELEAVARQYGLHPTSVQDCLDPEHLPKFERIENLNFVILRAYDDACPIEADTVQELTRKIAIFYSPKFIITVHRKDQPFLRQIRERWAGRDAEAKSVNVLADLLRGVFNTYEKPIDLALNQLELLEMGVFGAQQGARPFEIQQGYYLKRRASVFKRMLRVSIDFLPKMSSEGYGPIFQDVRETADSLYFFADELTESTNSLLNLHLSLASHRTNEVVRILTIFSVFLLPLNVLTGIYGMNFEHMPELKWQHGYPLAIGAMILVVVATYGWFRTKGWLKSGLN